MLFVRHQNREAATVPVNPVREMKEKWHIIAGLN